MKHVLVMVFIAGTLLTGCILVPPGHGPHGPGNSDRAPGHDQHGPGNSENAPGHNKHNRH